jgi:hypothetical protein
VESEILGPGVQDGGKPWLGTETVPTLGRFDERFGGGLEQKVIEAVSVS